MIHHFEWRGYFNEDLIDSTNVSHIIQRLGVYGNNNTLWELSNFWYVVRINLTFSNTIVVVEALNEPNELPHHSNQRFVLERHIRIRVRRFRYIATQKSLCVSVPYHTVFLSTRVAVSRVCMMR